MAVRARLLHATGVHVVFLWHSMQADGAMRNFLPSSWHDEQLVVAMPPAEGKVCLLVIECRAVELHDIGFAALVIGMTLAAFRVCGRKRFAVKAGFRCEVGGNILVAIHAQLGLCRPRERFVTVAAVRFKLGVTVDDLPGINRRSMTPCAESGAIDAARRANATAARGGRGSI